MREEKELKTIEKYITAEEEAYKKAKAEILEKVNEGDREGICDLLRWIEDRR